MADASYADISDLSKYGLPSAALSRFSELERQDALNGASAIADSYLQARFDLPLVSWGLDLRMAVVSIACFFLFRNRGTNPSSPNNNEEVRKAYEDAVGWLTNVSKGVALPTNVVDSSSGSTNQTGVPFNPSFTSQNPDAASTDTVDSFWGESSSSSSGTSKLRGW